MTAPSTPGAGQPHTMSKIELDRLADDLISEKSSKVPRRTRTYLNHPDIRGNLEKLVKVKIPLKDIQRGFVDKLDWKVSPAVFRTFMKEEFNYPEPTNKRVGVKKNAAKARSTTQRSTK